MNVSHQCQMGHLSPRIALKTTDNPLVGMSGLTVYRKLCLITVSLHFLRSPIRTPTPIFGMVLDLRNLCFLPLLGWGWGGGLLKAEPGARICVQAIRSRGNRWEQERGDKKKRPMLGILWRSLLEAMVGKGRGLSHQGLLKSIQNASQ